MKLSREQADTVLFRCGLDPQKPLEEGKDLSKERHGQQSLIELSLIEKTTVSCERKVPAAYTMFVREVLTRMASTDVPCKR